jgi:hypothetical protein
VLVQERKIACTVFPPWWNDDVQDLLVLEEGKLACAIFAP